MMPTSKTLSRILSDPIQNREIFKGLQELQTKALSKIKVGCIVEAKNYDDACLYEFAGCNIHVSDSFSDTHAERMAIDLAIKARCYPITIYVSSTSFDEDILLCGSCRHYISEINENCTIVVFNPDGSVKRVSNIQESYPNHKDVKAKNQRFFELCGGKPEQHNSATVTEEKHD